MKVTRCGLKVEVKFDPSIRGEELNGAWVIDPCGNLDSRGLAPLRSSGFYYARADALACALDELERASARLRAERAAGWPAWIPWDRADLADCP
jgi:hypothetical protein